MNKPPLAALVAFALLLVAAPAVAQESTLTLEQQIQGLGYWVDQWEAMPTEEQLEILIAERVSKGVPIPVDERLWERLAPANRVSLLLLRRVDQDLMSRPDVAPEPEPAPQPVIRMDPMVEAQLRARQQVQGRLMEEPYVWNATRPPGNLRSIEVHDSGHRRDEEVLYGIFIVTAENAVQPLPVLTDRWAKVDLAGACHRWADDVDACLANLDGEPARWVPVIDGSQGGWVTPRGTSGTVYVARLSSSEDSRRGMDLDCMEAWPFDSSTHTVASGQMACQFYPDAEYRSRHAIPAWALLFTEHPLTGER